MQVSATAVTTATTTTHGELTWEQRQLAKEHPIPIFMGIPDLELAVKFLDAVDHLAKLQGRTRDRIDLAWRHFGTDALNWFEKWLFDTYQITEYPSASGKDWPFSWPGFVTAFRHRFVPSYALEKVINDIRTLQYSKKHLSDFNKRFQELVKLAGGDLQAQKGTEFYRLYTEKLPQRFLDQLTVLTLTLKTENKVPTLEDVIATTQENAVIPTQISTPTSNITNANSMPSSTTASTAIDPYGPAPMDLSVLEQLSAKVDALGVGYSTRNWNWNRHTQKWCSYDPTMAKESSDLIFSTISRKRA
jgi:hypothetical protein